MDVDVRVEAVLSGRLAASSRFRVLQHIAPLRTLGIDVQARVPRISKYASVPSRWTQHRWSDVIGETSLRAAKVAVRLPSVAGSWRADVTWLEREMVPGHLTLEPLLHRPVLFDVDDAIWLLSPGNERAVRATAQRSACVVAGNDFIADWFSHAGGDVERVWTAIDTTRYVPGPASEDGFVVGWTGSTATLHFLRVLEPALAKFLRAAPDARLVVMADRAPTLAELPPERVRIRSVEPGDRGVGPIVV